VRIDQFISGEAVDRLLDVLLLVGPDGSILDANLAALRFYGYSHAEMLSLSIRDIRAPGDQDAIDDQMREASEREVLFEAEHCRSDGTLFHVEVRSGPVSVDGESALLGLVRDITERKHAEKELLAASHYSRSLIEASVDPLVTIDPDGKISDVNRATEEVTGVTRDKLIGTDFSDYFTEPDKAREGYERAFSERRVLDYPLAIRHVSGKVTDVIYNATVYRDDAGQVIGVFAAARDVTESKKAHAQAARLAAIVTSSHDAIFAKDFDERITSWNTAAEALHGWSAEEMIGRDAEVLMPAGCESEPRQLTERVRRGERISGFETQRKRKDGSVVEVSLTLSPILDDAGDIVAISVIAQDITERKHAEDEILRLNTGLEKRVQERTEELDSSNEELQTTNEECQTTNEELSETNLKLEEATRAKSDFLASMSHELRTPLNSIIGFSGIMLQGLAGGLTEEQSKQLGMINNSGRHLLELINQVLDLAKVESAQDRPTIRKVRVSAVARDMFDTVGPMAEAKGIDTRWTCPEGLRLIRTDKLRIGQILLNLMGNAVKFTEHGFVSVTVSQDDSGVAIAVKDSGCGIAAEDLERVFDDFYQVSPHVSAKSEGTGLGLTVSRRLAESIGARIEVTSEPGRGSAFTLLIPDRSRERDLPVGQSRIDL
jgi:PAS domain S-box-containing protein